MLKDKKVLAEAMKMDKTVSEALLMDKEPHGKAILMHEVALEKSPTAEKGYPCWKYVIKQKDLPYLGAPLAMMPTMGTALLKHN
ncbi:hypothetical protein ACLOJK_037925 [Asimina triloba]